MIKLATLFSGIGSVEQAFKRLRIPFKLVFACDNGEIENDFNVESIKNDLKLIHSRIKKKEYIDKLYKNASRKINFVKQSYLANYDIDMDHFYLDVRFLNAKFYKNKVDMLVGGSPCQSFSSVGKKGGLEDTRGTLFYDYARIIKECSPKVFIYENVRGLLTHDSGNTWKKIKSVFTKDLHYDITEPKILNAADYGIPQNRRRLFVIGIRKDLKAKKFTYPKPLGANNLYFYVQDILENNCMYNPKKYNFYSDKNGKLIVKKVKGSVDKKYILTPKVRDYVLSPGTKKFKTSVKTDLPIARTLLKTMTQHHRAGIDNYITVGKEKNGKKIIRSLTERECLRLMGFPDSFKIVVSTQQMKKQAGNSIVVDVMMAILNKIFETNVLKRR